MIWIALIIGIILIFMFPKQMGILAGVIVLGIAGFYFYIQAEENSRAQERDSVTISIRYDVSACSIEYPLAINFKNGSKKIVKKISWNIAAYRSGYSNNIVEYEGYTSEYSTPYESDRILNPNQGFGLCYKAPKLNAGNEPAAVNWNAVSKSINFQ